MVRKRTVSKTLSRVERFENGTVWKRCFPSVDGENDTIWKQWRHHNNTTWLYTTQPWVYKIADRRFQMVSLLIAVIFSLLTLLEAHLTLLRQIFHFSRREQNIIKLLIFFGQRNEDDKNDSVEARQNLDGSGKDQDELQNSSVVGQL